MLKKLISKIIAFGILFFLMPFCTLAQQTGTEQLVTKNIYKGDFTVAGDKDTYYPVVFKNGEQNMINHLKIYRSYHEAGPNELSLTHKGGLLLEFDVNYGGWGGQAYGWKVANHQYAYYTTFANATHSMWNMGFTVWLRGGRFVYHYESEKPAQLQVAYSTTETIYYNASYPQYIGSTTASFWISDDLVFFDTGLRTSDNKQIFEAYVNDTKLTTNAPWTKNQTEYLMKPFRDGETQLEFEVLSDQITVLPKNSKVIIKKQNVFKSTSCGNNRSTNCFETNQVTNFATNLYRN